MADHQWVKPLHKFKNRVNDLKLAGASVSVNAHDYNTRILPVLSYVAQLSPLPSSFAFDQRVACHVIYRAPFNVFAHSDIFQWATMGLPNIRCGISASAAALMRTALKTVTHWSDWIAQMCTTAQEHLPSALALHPRDPQYWQSFWDSPPFAVSLLRASQGRFDNPDLDNAGAEIIRKNSDAGGSPPPDAPGGL